MVENNIQYFFEENNIGWMHPLIGNTDLSKIQHHQFLSDDTIIICSDGGLKDDNGSYGTLMFDLSM
jgi:hypothetical protein